MKHILQSQQGFTLIEVMIAIIILGIGLLALITMQSTGIFGNATANQITVSSNLAANRIERIMALPYDHAELRDTNNSGVAGLDAMGDAADGKEASPDGYYTIYWNVAEDTPMPNLKKVRIHVHRNERGQDKRVSMDYIKARYF
ncbi:MAG: type IV pilus modification protein PilV [Desulfobulbaceae bacterium]|nr:type IV pilus modification protein PilV [Desulfobulbaceae bacterium]